MAEQTNEDDAEPLYETLTGTQKSAILMMLLGEEEAVGDPAQPVATRGPASWNGHVFRAGPRSGHGEQGS